ncbi:MAG: MBL fold metallo-hydrolase [Parvibaculum sp.]|uniref:MBL fold metallo-hydrolase n=1 Tax=Parvibaculum sp. TaxID=2024848 RepID=UPI0025F67062|nr:MBL fold metallo-hydrolase [Parvibaculum sp.]MCE9648288.1 MBL fold metallo-hydrolase [Parvibaculum sp.]
MSTWKRIALIVLAVIVVVGGGGAYYWLIVESHAPGDAEFAIDLSEVRRLADERTGDRPLEIHVEKVAAFSFPATAIVAGDGWSKRDVPVFSYQLIFPDGSSAIIDTALSEKLGQGNLSSFDKDAYASMEKAMGKAKLIVITHEHMDHIGGLTEYPDLPKILPSTELTQEQVDHPERSVPAAFPQGALDGYKPLAYDKYVAVAPGVVLIKSPGHSPGSQMVYVKKVDGTEVLFIGDVAWQFRNIELIRERARLVTQFLIKEDRRAVFGQLKELARIHAEEPKLAIVPGHDGKVIEALVANKILAKGFE